MKTARGMVRPWTKHGRSLMASTDGLCLLQRLGQSLQNLRWPRDGTPDDNVFTTLLNLIYKCGFQPKLPERGCERSHKDWLISLLPGMSSGLERSTSRLSSPCWAISQQSRYAQEYLCIFLSPVFFFPPGCQEPKTSRCVSRLWWETEDHLIFSMVWSNVLWSWGVPDCYKPMIFKNGIRKPFPRPTKKVKAPVASFR